MLLAVALTLAFDLAVALLVRPWPLTVAFILLGLASAYWSLQSKRTAAPS